MFFLTFFSYIDYYKILSRVTVLDKRFLFICLYIEVCICYSEIPSLPLPTPLLSPADPPADPPSLVQTCCCSAWPGRLG